MGMGQTVEAGKDFDKAAELSPKYVNAYNNRGLLYLSQRKFEEAIIEFNRALEIDCNYTDAYNNRGFAEFEIGRVGAALDDFNSALRLNKDYVNAYNNRGLLRARVGDFENAVSDFTAAMMIDPLNPKYYEHRRDVYRNQGALDKAQLDDRKIAWLIDYHRLTAAIATSIQPAGKLIQPSQHYLKIDDFDKAIDDLNRAIQLDPLSADALALRANAHLGRKEIEAAQADAEASLAIKLNDDACSVLGDVYLSKKEYDKAIEYFAKARRIDESVAEAYYAKSKVLAQQGNTDLAKTNLEQALALDPGIEDRLR